MFEELKENPIRYLKSLAMDFVVVLVAISYIFYQMITLEKTDTNPIVLIAKAFMGIICGIIIKQALGENGFSKGYRSDNWTREEALYNQACNTAVDYTERVDNFYLCLEKEKKENYRRNHLQAVRLKYDTWFDKEGDYIEHEIWNPIKKKHYLRKLKKENKDKKDNEVKKLVVPDEVIVLSFRQILMLRKCIKVKIYVLNLFSEYATSTEQDTKKEMTDKRQRAKNATKNTLSAVLVAIIGVYFIPVLDHWSWASLIASTMQVTLWVLLGILQLYTNYNFVTQDKVAILRKKKELISRFVKDSENNLYLTSPYKEVK